MGMILPCGLFCDSRQKISNGWGNYIYCIFSIFLDVVT